nr:uncharacterized protein LOC105328385 [Crassostrea gigas]
MANETRVGGDLDLLFDFLSRKLSPQDLLLVSVHLLGETQMAETSRSQSYPSETYFRILHTWRCKHPSIDHQGKLKEVFHSMERQDLIDEMEGFSRDQYIFNASQIVEPEKQVENSDLTTIAKNLGSRYYNVMRFLGINQRTIDQIEADHSSIKEQIYESLLYLKRLKPTLTRQTMCNALFYADHSDVIENLNSKWKHRGIP